MDKRFRPDRKSSKSKESKIPEYNFQEGVDVAVARIQELLRTIPDRNIYVVINGSGNDVGKTRLLGAIQQKLALSDIDAIERRVFFGEQQEKSHKKGRNYREDYADRKPGLEIGELADFYIGIYSTNKPFTKEENYEPVGDIIIRNEHATIDPDKIRFEEK